MNQTWSDADLNKHWVLSESDLTLLKGRSVSNRIAMAVQLKHYQLYACFIDDIYAFGDVVMEFITAQLETVASSLEDYDCNGRTGRQHRKEILLYLNVKPFAGHNEPELKKWLIAEILSDAPNRAYLKELVIGWFLRKQIERPGQYRLRRIIRSAENEFESQLFSLLSARLNVSIQAKLDGLVAEQSDGSLFAHLCSDTGPVSLGSVMQAIDKIQLLRRLGLPEGILHGINPKLISRYRERAATENAWEIRRHPNDIRYALLAFYCVPREGALIDGLVELLIQIIHRISARAEKKVVKELVKEVTKVHSKNTLLYRIAEAVQKEPDGSVRDVIFPVANEQTIDQLVKEYRSSGPAYTKHIYTKIRSSYAHHYRKMLPSILSALEFRSNNTAWRPILEAIEVIKASSDSREQYFALDDVPTDGLVQSKWREIVIEIAPDGSSRINRINYEICVLQELREKLRCKEVWVVGADHFCNPEQDLPDDFAVNRDQYYAALDKPLDSQVFIEQVKLTLNTALGKFNKHLPQDKKVQIKLGGKKATISVTPLTALDDPPNIEALKNELSKRWPETGLLDVLKETNFRTEFTQAFSTSASREVTDPDEILRRLLLTLYALGTNAGLKRLVSGRQGISYKELLHIRRRYINKDNLRDAIRRIINATFEVRDSAIWGEATTSCASDSTQFGAWDQNLITEWHARYGGRGIMIYWHVDTNSACIYSQLKRCSSSEVASMIEGVLHHCTNMKVEKQYVDSHGQSVVAFAFCHLLNFSLMPRLKALNTQKVSPPDISAKTSYSNLTPIFSSKVINWKLIARQYDEMIKLATALREHTATPEAILRRFIRSNSNHPTYRALIELGKAVKTIFLCHYLSSEELRREINTGLNVIERWNGVNGFIYFGKKGEVASNKLEDQEISVLALHLLQISLVYINTLMIQQILKEPAWKERMTERDMAAVTPLPHRHINPYGVLELDMSHRLPLAA